MPLKNILQIGEMEVKASNEAIWLAVVFCCKVHFNTKICKGTAENE